jgi:hypothetical protein
VVASEGFVERISSTQELKSHIPRIHGAEDAMEVADAAVDGPQDATFTRSHDQDCDVFGDLFEPLL